MDFSLLTDEQLIQYANSTKKESEQALEELLKRYKSAVNCVSRGYFLNDGDMDDLVQEGMIGVFKAMGSYNGAIPFKAYAYRCIKTNILSAIKKSNSDKNKPLNNFVPLISLDGDDDKNALMRGEECDPEEEYINKEREKELLDVIDKTLSDYEKKVLSLYLKGYSYIDIGEKTGKNIKAVDNAVQRIRKKLTAILMAK